MAGAATLEAHKKLEGKLPKRNGLRAASEFLEWLCDITGEDIGSEALAETPRRVVESWIERTGGYQKDPSEILRVTFPAHCDEMVTLRDITFFSTCEHHLLPFSGRASVAYLPGCDGRVVGISKLARLVDCFARRLQLQERMTAQIADALVEHLGPAGVGVVVEASHLCMVCRGVMKSGATMRTTALRGVLRDSDAARAEFLSGAGFECGGTR